MAVNSEPQVFLFLSDILGKKIVESDGRPVGRIVDLVANVAEPYPPVTELVTATARAKELQCFSWQKVKAVADDCIVMPLAEADLREPYLGGDELLLMESLLDMQIVDTNGA